MPVPRGAPERLLVDQLAETVEERGALVSTTRAESPLGLETEAGELLAGMGQHVDPDTDRADLADGFKQAKIDPGVEKLEPEREPADPRTDNHERHVLAPSPVRHHGAVYHRHSRRKRDVRCESGST